MKPLKIISICFMFIFALMLSQCTAAEDTSNLTFTKEEIVKYKNASNDIDNFLKNNEDIRKKYDNLFFQSGKGNFEVVKHYLDNGGIINLNFIVDTINYNNLKGLKYLIEFLPGDEAIEEIINVDIYNNGNSLLDLALARARMYKSLDIVDYLRSKGATFIKDKKK